MDHEDPFGAFGEGDDDDDDSDDDEKRNDYDMVVAKSLVKAANEKIAQPITNELETTKTKQKLPGPSKRDHHVEDLSYMKSLDLAWNDPSFKGDIVLISSLPLGGGRGYVASKTLKPGTLVLLESPIMEWSEEQIGKKLGLLSVKHLLECSKASQLIHDIEDLHPTKEQVDSHALDGRIEDENHEQISKMIQVLQLEYSPCEEEGEIDKIKDFQVQQNSNVQSQQDIADLVKIALEKDLCSRDGSALTNIDILRLLLAFRYNGLESGLYLHVAMLNHDDYPNCVKMLPSMSDGPSGGSEVRTTREIHAGEVLTISYLPRVVSHASRRNLLWEQHRFDIGINHLKGEKYKMELIGNKLPPSSCLSGSDEESVTYRIESATEELEKMHIDIAGSLQLSPSNSNKKAFELSKEIEQSVLELYNESKFQLKNEHHILLIPILTLHIESCAAMLKDSSLTNTMLIGVLLRQIRSAYTLLPLKKALSGDDHFDVGRISLDLSNSISELLSRAPTKLYELKWNSMKTFAAWSNFEQHTRKEYNRIQALYPYDAEVHTNT